MLIKRVSKALPTFSTRCLATTTAVAFAFLIQACGSSGKINPPSSSETPANFNDDSGVGGAGSGSSKTPPKEYYLGLLEKSLKDAEASGGNAALTDGSATPPTIFVNFDGQAVQKGFAASQSFLVCGATANIPAASANQSTRDAIITAVKAHFDAAGVMVVITDDRPSAGFYSTVLVGGNYEMLGCGKAPGSALAIAPMDRGNFNPSDLAFVFPAEQPVAVQAAVISRSVGHIFGLENTNNPEDLMATHVSEKSKGFASGKALGSGGTQDGLAALKHNLRQDGAASQGVVGGTGSQVPGLVNLTGDLVNLPGLENISGTGKVIGGLRPQDVVNISALLAQIRAVLPASIAIPSLEKAVTAIALADSASGGSGVGKTNVGGVSQIFQKILSNPAALSATGGALSALATLGGFGGSAGAIGTLLGAFGQAPVPATSPAPAAPTPVLPDFAGILGITSQTDLAQLLGPYLNGHISVINSNFAGDVKAALISMTKVAYAQAFSNALTSMPALTSANGK